jgi:transcriptional regulator with GAF, ATPase, and Fis domain
LEPPPTAAPELDAATLLAALRKHDFSPKRAAEELGIANSTLHYLMQKTGLARRASDYSKEELQAALAAAGGNVENAAQTLQVSERALTMAARRFGLVE